MSRYVVALSLAGLACATELPTVDFTQDSEPEPERTDPCDMQGIRPLSVSRLTSPPSSGKPKLVRGEPTAVRSPCRANRKPLPSIVGSVDAEVVGDPSVYPYATAVQVVIQHDETEGTFTCSGALVGPHHVLTAGHCVYDNEYGYGWASSIDVIPGTSNGEEPYGIAHAVNYWAYEAWIDSSPDNEGWPHDLSLVTLDRNVGEFTGWLGLEYYGDSDDYLGEWLNMNHYPVEEWGDGQTMYHGYDVVIDADSLALVHALDTTGGSSGGILYRYDGSDGRYAQAIHSVSFDDGSGNGAPHLTKDRLDDILDSMEEDPEPTDLADLVDGGSALHTSMVIAGEDSLSMDQWILNLGTDDAFDVDLETYLSLDAQITSDDIELGSARCSTIPPFRTCGGAASLDVPAGVPEGTYHVIWRIDPLDLVPEFEDADNDTVASETVIVQAPAEPGDTRTLDGDDDADSFGDGSSAGGGCTTVGLPAVLGLAPLLSAVALSSRRRAKR